MKLYIINNNNGSTYIFYIIVLLLLLLYDVWFVVPWSRVTGTKTVYVVQRVYNIFILCLYILYAKSFVYFLYTQKISLLFPHIYSIHAVRCWSIAIFSNSSPFRLSLGFLLFHNVLFSIFYFGCYCCCCYNVICRRRHYCCHWRPSQSQHNHHNRLSAPAPRLPWYLPRSFCAKCAQTSPD